MNRLIVYWGCTDGFKYESKKASAYKLISITGKTIVFYSTFFLLLLLSEMCVLYAERLTIHKKRSFTLRIFSVNVTKSAVSSGFGDIYWRNP